MQVAPVDPRDVISEDTAPAYRVYFWRPLDAPGAFESTEFELTDADAEEVFAWARTTAASEETFTVYAVVQRPDGRGLVRLAGTDPTAP